ncbi:hypothetical protein Landi51_02987 [Colletotrichum acutatum]
MAFFARLCHPTWICKRHAASQKDTDSYETLDDEVSVPWDALLRPESYCTGINETPMLVVPFERRMAVLFGDGVKQMAVSAPHTP